MERLTERMNDEINGVWVKEHDYISAAHRLADYEDTGLTPEQCAEYAKADREGRYIVLRDAEQEGVKRLRELAKADKEGRVVVLPCKPRPNGCIFLLPQLRREDELRNGG